MVDDRKRDESGPRRNRLRRRIWPGTRLNSAIKCLVSWAATASVSFPYQRFWNAFCVFMNLSASGRKRG